MLVKILIYDWNGKFTHESIQKEIPFNDYDLFLDWVRKEFHSRQNFNMFFPIDIDWNGYLSVCEIQISEHDIHFPKRMPTLIIPCCEKTGAFLITQERQRQILSGYKPQDDIRHEYGELVQAAESHLVASRDPNMEYEDYFWPWIQDTFKKDDGYIKNLIKAGALIAADIDRAMAEGIT